MAREIILATGRYGSVIALLSIALFLVLTVSASPAPIMYGDPALQNSTGTRSSGESSGVPVTSAIPSMGNLNVPGLPGAPATYGMSCPDQSVHGIAWCRSGPGQQIGIVATDSGTILFAGAGGSFIVQLDGIGRPGGFRAAEPGEIRASADGLDIVRPGSTEWYRMDGAGIEQGMRLDSRPAGNGTLLVNFTLAGTLHPSLAGQTLIFFDAAGPVMHYGGLAAHDATGRELPASLALSQDTLTWQIDDRDAVYPITIDPWIAKQEDTLTPSDAAGGNSFGYSLALSDDGNTAVIGAVNANFGTGRAYIFTKSGSTWSETVILDSPDPSNEFSFGLSVAISADGSTAVIGTNDYTTGRAYVFTNSLGTWSQTASLSAVDGENVEQFGNSVAISGAGDTAIVGANWATADSKSRAGKAYVFTDSGGTWSQTAILKAQDAAASANFGNSVAISEDGGTGVIGAYVFNSSAGQAYVFTNSGGTWSQAAILNASDVAADASFGNSVAISEDGGTALIGAYQAHVGSISDAGQAYVFANSGGTWSQTAVLKANDASTSANFGNSVAISDDGGTALIGAYWAPVNSIGSAGKAYIFKRNSGTWSWAVSMNAADIATDADFGSSVAISDDGAAAVIGAKGFGSSAGKAYDFNISSSTPQVYGISPSSWPNTTTKKVTVTGNGFNTTVAPVVNLTRTGHNNITINVNSWDLVSPSVFYVTIPSNKEAGVWNVTVINPDGEEGTNASVTFTITAPPRLTAISPASGVNTASTLVTVTGTQFSSTAAPVVNLTKSGSNNITMTATNLSSTSFTVAVPPDAAGGIWNVVVVNPDGVEATNASVTFTVLAPPRLIAISPTSGANATETLVTVTGSRFSTGSAPVVNMSSAGKSNITMTATNLSSTSFTVTVPNHNLEAVWNVTVINPDGLEGTNASVTFSTTDPPPIADFSFEPAAGLAPLSVTFTDKSINVPDSWSWDFGDGDTTGAMLQNPVRSYALPGIYSVSLSATNYLGTGTKSVLNGISVMALVNEIAAVNAASDAVADDMFGTSVALSRDGNSALVAAEWIFLPPLTAHPPGKVYVFTKSGGVWSRSAVLQSPDGADNDQFGESLAISEDGTTVLAGSIWADVGATSDAGKVYVFTKSGGTWSQTATLTASDPSSTGYFGSSIALSGDTALIGSDGADKSYVFKRSGTSWSEQQILTSSDGASGDNFGNSLAVSYDGNTAIIGADDASFGSFLHFPGKAYIFTKSGGTWSEAAILSASDADDMAKFGTSVALSDDGSTAVIGAIWATKGSTEYVGKAYIFTKSGSTWSETVILNAPESANYQYFGGSVALYGDTAVIGNVGKNSYTAGRAFVYQKDGDSWYGTHVLNESDAAGDRYFGNSVALFGKTALIGAYNATAGTTAGAGQAYFFTITALAPVVAGINPATGTNSAVTTVTITGSNFNATFAPVVKLTRTGYADVTLGVVSGTSTSLVRTVPAYVDPGIWNIVVTNPDGQEGTSASVTYTVQIPQPSITSVIPASGVNTSAVSTVITGTGFNTTIPGGTTVNLTRAGYANISVPGITPDSITRISLDLPITNAEAGTWYLVVINPDRQESAETVPFRIAGSGTIPPPSVTSITPANGINTGAVSIAITGTGFNTTMTGGTTVSLTRSGFTTISVHGLTPALATGFTANLPITDAEAGTWNLVVVNPDGQESVELIAFVITSPAPTTIPTTTVPTTIPDPPSPPANPAGSDDSGSSASIPVSPPSTTVAVNIGGNSQIGRATVTGTGLKDLIVTGTVLSGPGRATTTPTATVFQYVSILPARYTTVTKAVLDFSVPQSWLDENHIAPENVALYRYTGGTWTALPTMVTKTGNGRISLAATSPGFSLFAIAGTAGSPTVSPPDNVQPSGANPGTGITTGTAEQILTVLLQSGDPGSENTSAARTGPDAGFPPATIAGIAAGGVLLIGAGWYLRRWWRYRQNPALFMEYD